MPRHFSYRQREHSLFAVEAQNIKVYNRVQIESGFQLLQANNTVELMYGSKIKSTRKYMCNLHKRSLDMYTCMDKNPMPAESLDYQDLITRF